MTKLDGRYHVTYKGKTKKVKLRLEGEAILDALLSRISAAFSMDQKDVYLQYRDESGDCIMIDQEEELADALEEMKETMIKFVIKERTCLDDDTEDNQGMCCEDGAGPRELYDPTRGDFTEPLQPVEEITSALPGGMRKCCNWPVAVCATFLIIGSISVGVSSDIGRSKISMGGGGESYSTNPPTLGSRKGGSGGVGGSSTPQRMPTVYPSSVGGSSTPQKRPTPPPSSAVYKPSMTLPPTYGPGFPMDWRYTIPDSESPITSINDPRYGVDETAKFTERRKKFWKYCEQHRLEEQDFKKRNYHNYGEAFDMLITWETSRNETCNKLNFEKEKLYPPKYVMDKDMNGGTPSHKLPFDPSVLKKHVIQFKNKLLEYYENKENIKLTVHPKPFEWGESNENSGREEGYDDGMDQLAEMFARKLVHSQPITIGVLGTSVVAAQDNCFHYAYPNQLGRILRPLFKAGGVDINIRTSGQNGDGGAAHVQIKCIESILGTTEELDIVQFGWWMIPTPAPINEESIRRLLSAGVFPHFSSRVDQELRTPGEKSAYYKLGMMEMGNYQELYSRPNGQWWPALGKSHWGRQGDGYCHRVTREGTLGVLFYNWHPGPLGFQVMADLWAYRYTEALRMAIHKIEAAIKAFGDEKLKTTFPAEKIKMKLPDIKDCDQDYKEEMCKPEKPFDQGYKNMKCVIGQHPQWGPRNLTTWALATDPNGHSSKAPYKFGGINWHVKQTKPASNLGTSFNGAKGTAPQPQFKDDPKCAHPDTGFELTGDSNAGYISFQLPDMKRGIVTVCNKDKRWGYTRNAEDKNVFKIDGEEVRPDYQSQVMFSCMTLADDAKYKGTGHILTIKTDRPFWMWALIAE